MRARTLMAAWLLALCFPCVDAGAHGIASSRLDLDVSEPARPTLRLDLPLVDLASMVRLDGDDDGEVTWGEVRRVRPAFDREVLGALRVVRGSRPCRLAPAGAPWLAMAAGERQISVDYLASCAGAGDRYTVHFDLPFRHDPLHRVAVRFTSDGASRVAVLRAGAATAAFEAGGSWSLAGMFGEGFHHILEGYDHLLFLLLLILPAAGRGRPRERFLGLLAVVTAFTLAHSLTLALATTGVVTLPARIVETAIAASIVIAGLGNVWRPQHRMHWKLAFAFGLLHGFGFAGALAEIGLVGGGLLWQLFAFNAGVEAGQLLVVLLVLPLVGLMLTPERSRAYVTPVLSGAGAVLGAVWMLSRF